MSAAPAYGSLLKRQPSQARSARRVEAILDGAAGLLREREPDALTVRDIAAAAAVPTGTVYQFFDDKDAVLQALAVRFVADMPSVLDAALASNAGWERTVDRVVDAYAAMVREHPAIRRLWLSGALDAGTRRLERETDADIAARLGTAMRARSGRERGAPEQWRALVALIDGLLRHAFAEHPDGEPAALRETRRAARAYTAAVLGPTPS